MKLPPLSITALTLSLLATGSAQAMDKREADAICASWKLKCPEGSEQAGGPARKSGTLECRAKSPGRLAKQGPAVTCKDGQAQSFGDWKDGKKQGRHVTMRANGSWLEEDFVEGKLEGRQVEYSAEGVLVEETHYKAGKKHGRARSYREDGRVAIEEAWENGRKAKKDAVARQGPGAEPQGQAQAQDTP